MRIKYLCERCVNDYLGCVVCDGGSKFIEGKRGSKSFYDPKRFSEARKQKTVKDLFDSLTAEERDAMYFMIGEALHESVYPEIKKVHFNDPATIVIWADGTKTIVRCQEGDIYDPEKGLAMAIAKKSLGNKGNYCEVFKKWLPKEDVEKEDANDV